MLLLTFIGSAARLDGTYLHEVTTDLVTPHYSLAKPLAGGPIKALFITPGNVAAREVVELAQRLSLDFEVVTTYSPVLLASSNKYSAEILGTSPKEKEAELLKKLRTRYDVIIFGNFTYDALPINAKYEILRQVASGSGLVFTYGSSTDKRLFVNESSQSLNNYVANLPWRDMDYFMRKGSIGGYTLGKGRIVHIDYGERATGAIAPGLTPPIRNYSRSWEQTYNYYLGLIGKSMVWAANRESGFSLAINRDGTVHSRDKLPVNIQMEINAPQQDDCNVVIRLLDEYGRVIESYEEAVVTGKGRTQTDIELPRLPVGSYFCEGVLKNKDGVLDWATINFSVRDKVQIDTLTFSDNKGQVKLTTPATTELVLNISLLDYWGRLLSKKEYVVEKGDQTIDYSQSLEKCLTKFAIIRAELIDNEEIVTWKEEEFYSGTQTASQLFPSLIWGGFENYAVSIFHKRQLKALGFDMYLEHPSSLTDEKFTSVSAATLAAADFDFIPYAYRIYAAVNPEGWTIDQWFTNQVKSNIEDRAFSNPEIKKAALNVLQNRINGIPESNPGIYSLGDENSFSYDGGYSPSEIIAFRDFLQKKYGILDKLNAAWGTNFSDWGFPIPARDEMQNETLYPARHDQMSFLEEQYATYHRTLADYIRSVDEGAMVGAEGSVPGDLERTLDGLDFWAPYYNTREDALLRSLRPDILRGNWWGGYGSRRSGMAKLLELWPQVLLGNANMSLFYISHGVHGVMGADLMPAKYFSDVMDEYDEIRQYMGPLISSAEANDDGIAIHYSIASDHLSSMIPGSASPATEQTVLIDLLDGQGYGYKYLSSKQIEGGQLLSGETKTLFLSLSQALSDKEQVELRKFVEKGGTVVADLNPGIADGNCKLNKGGTGSLFGVEFIDVKYHNVSDVVIESNSILEEVVTVKNTIVNPSIKIVDATGVSYSQETPIMITNKIGAGKTYLLNLVLSTFKEEPEALKIINGILNKAGINKKYNLVTEDVVVAKSYKNGQQEILTAYFPQILTANWTLETSESRHVWDSRTGRYLGYGTQFEIPVYIERHPAYVFAIQEDNQQKISFDLPASCSLGDSISCSIKLENDNVDFRIIRLDVYTPDGKLFEPFTRTIKVEGSGMSFKLDVALNDQKGTWLFKASDVSTGCQVEKSLEVK